MFSASLPTLVTLLAAASLTRASPSKTVPELPKRANSVPAVTASGNAFWAGSTRFYVRGIDYQPGGSSEMADPLADSSVCNRDITEFKKLGVNTVRVYITDNSKNHDDCMNALADAGIYVILDANNPLYSINRDTPAPSYNSEYLQSVFATVDAFANYTNTLAFFSGNEVINSTAESTLSAPYVKAVTRDMRQYIKNRGYRSIPVGYSAADVSTNRLQLADYMNCGTDDERSDFFAFNDYSWCNTNFATSGWDQKVKNFTGYGLPIFLSEYGCITNGRDFGEISALMNSEMTSVYSGGLLYEYALEANKFGIASISGTSVSELPEFTKFASALSKNPAPTGDGGFTSTTNTAACPTKDTNWLVDSTLLPAIPAGAEAYMKSGAGTGPGLTGSGSQNGQGTSTGYASPGSGSSTASATSSKKSAGSTLIGPMDKSPLIVSAVVFFFSLCGALIL
ncbi:beta-glucanosyltransferase gel1 [Grosmannia clavigera kw1407]|uniref:1,3-beta-glucanosyltransferase n=1 Tax=Grosmannia clavigera (strain kw1407 / UAMH 11150) TaxID=655863 RepID=F0XSX3_GROCL|nr:beta-glucanosyltransferase gel1 [Grosmannia clavigera kw1407]EFW99224.1 beta-glucanosyltransferase gel1 [Grosmannia clavigera kw1407]